jgi:MAP3K TRAFs-binding domain
MSFPLCFVLMPFGTKSDSNGLLIDFDAVYQQLIAPAIRDASLEPLRADEEMTGGIIHKPMFERLVLCEYAVADLTTANANVFYELGVRHAVRPWSTVLIFAGGTRLPFDVAPLRGLPYSVDAAGKLAEVERVRTALAARLNVAKQQADHDSPLFQLLDGLQPPDIARLKTDSFRDRVDLSLQLKERLASARRRDVEAVREIEHSLGDISQSESAVVVDLFLSYRAVKAWTDMVALVGKMSKPLAATVLIQEQLALALNRQGEGEQAEQILLELIRRRGPSSETYGILGRVYKDRWDVAVKSNQSALARGMIEKAIAAYLAGFEADWRDGYPGINAVTLMELRDPPDPRRLDIIPVVRYTVSRRIAGRPDYWDYATLLELEVLAKREENAMSALADALASVRETWEPETTANNIRLIRTVRTKRNELQPWIAGIEEALFSRAAAMAKRAR